MFDGRSQVARHERATVRGSQTLVLDHYLEVLVRKPGALPGATALVQARAAGTFTAAHEAFWSAARKALGDSGGTRALVEVCCCTATTPTPTSSPASAPRWESPRSALTWSRSRPANTHSTKPARPCRPVRIPSW